VGIVAALGLLFAGIDADAGLASWWQLRSRAAEARVRVARLEDRARELEREIAALQSDPLAIEGAIREDLELARAGESVVRFAPASPMETRLRQRPPGGGDLSSP